MDSEFHIPAAPESLEKDFVQDVTDIDGLNERDIHSLLDDVGFTQDSDVPETLNIVQQHNFDRLYSLASKHLLRLSAEVRTKLLDTLTHGFATFLMGVPTKEEVMLKRSQDGIDPGQLLQVQRTAMKMFTWLLYRIVILQERNKDVEEDRIPVGRKKRKRPVAAGFEERKEKLLRHLTDSVDTRLNHVWDMGRPDERFLGILSQTAIALMENANNVADPATMAGIVSLLGASIQHHLALGASPAFTRRLSCGEANRRGSMGCEGARRESCGSITEGDSPQDLEDGTEASVQQRSNETTQEFDALTDVVINPIVEALIKHEHVAKVVADLIQKLQKEPSQRGFVPVFMRHVFVETTTQFDGSDSSGARNVAQVLMEISEQTPTIILENISAIHGNLDCESYVIRNAVVHSMAQVVVKLLSPDQSAGAAKLRDQFLGILQDRIRDVNSYCRSKVLSVWKDMWCHKAVPLVLHPTILQLSIGRLRDKTTIVRKSAVQLLTAMLENNPYGSSLVLTAVEKRLKEAEDRLKKHDEDLAAQNPDGPDITDMMQSLGPEEDGEETLYVQPQSSDLVKLKHRMQFRKCCCDFIQQMHSAMTQILPLLFSKTLTDVQEAIRFVEMAHQFNLEPSQAAANKASILIFHSDEKIRETAEASFQSMLWCWGPRQTAEPAIFVRRLLKLVSTAQEGELASLEEIISRLTKKDLIGPATVETIWALVAGQGASDLERRYAMRMFAMVANNNPGIVQQHLTWIADVGLKEKSRRDPIFGVHACLALQKLASLSKGGCEKFAADDNVIFQLTSLISRKTNNLSLWMPLAEAALDTVYALCTHPLKVTKALLKRLHARCEPVLQYLKVSSTPHDSDETDCNAAQALPAPEVEGFAKLGISEHEARAHLMRLIFVVGHSALKQLVFLEEQKEQAKARADAAEARAEAKEAEGDSDDEGIAAQLGLQSSQVAEAEAEKELLQQLHQMSSSSSPWCQHMDLIREVCLDPLGQPLIKHPVLRGCAGLSLCKLMLLTEKTCSQENLQILFTILDKAPEWHVRCNMAISIGDLLCRFPNRTGRWVDHFFSAFRDPHPSVRLTLLNMSQHLILNNMLRAQSNMYHLALATQDPDPKVADMARLFFQKYDKADRKKIYNSVLEVFNQLASMPIPEDRYQRIMAFLLGFIEKEGEAESLIETLCKRIDQVGYTDLDGDKPQSRMRQARKVAYCLAQLKMESDKCLRKLDACFPLYAKVLADEVVYQHFLSIIMKFKRFTREGHKSSIEELESKITQRHNAGIAAQEAEEEVQQQIETHQRSKAKRVRLADEDDYEPEPPKNPKAKDGKKPAAQEAEAKDDDNEGEEDVFEREEPGRPVQPKRQASQRASQRRFGLREDSDEDDDQDASDDMDEDGEAEGEEEGEGEEAGEGNEGDDDYEEGEAAEEQEERVPRKKGRHGTPYVPPAPPRKRQMVVEEEEEEKAEGMPPAKSRKKKVVCADSP